MEVLWILLVPFAWLLAAKFWLRTTFNWKELGVSLLVVTVLTTATWQLGKYGQTRDTEVWNGEVTKKEVNDGYYQTSYCCATDKDGHCTSTCYDDHYTRSYDGHTTVGSVTFDSIDTGSKSRRNSFPPPASYKRCQVGEPASIEHGYTNYVQAVPKSLFHDDGTTASKMFAGQIPAYPRVHNFYKFNRVINVGSKVTATQIKVLDNDLDNVLKYLGRVKQANIIVILTEIDDPSYRYAVEQAWLGGEKNDIVIFIGLDDYKITWVDVMTWALNSGNELFHVTMRDGITDMKNLSVAELTPFIAKTVTEKYDRPHMKDYEYLADEIDPPSWVFWLAMFFAFGGSAILTLIFHKHEIR